ncbi:replication initiator protein [Blackfly microvirus SF02]|uniref:Replication initiator protein n=1 Tax=Blackfly microvirus SF02 TaxID=2576452 RepID=A0A4P8PK84_9VIRU|nr:replication initiator protein [Blackfly microvirus SF02]
MACYHPVKAYRDSSGGVVFVERGDLVNTLWLPCGRCPGCRLERSRQWSVRIQHESSLYERSAFATLTYSDEFVPTDGSLAYSHYQKFMRRVREKFGPTRFFMCGEYGEDKLRPHFHAGLFGLWPYDAKPWRKGEYGHMNYRSGLLESCWKLGNVEFGILCQQSAAYMARYTFKKVTGDKADVHYEGYDVETGELVHRVPEFCHMSLRPGIGARWFAKYASDVFPHDRVVMRGVVGKPPRYYDILLKRSDPVMLEVVQQERIMAAAKLGGVDTTEERLAVREKVTEARIAHYKRKL